MKRNTDRRLNRIIHHLDIATKTKPRFDHDAANDLAWLDTNQTNETGIIAQGIISDPVAAQVIARSRIINRTNDIDQIIRRLESDARNLVAKLNAGQPRTPAAQNEPLCTGGDPSTWGDPTCGELVDSFQRDDGTTSYRNDGLCARHRVRKHRHDHSTPT